MPRPCDRGARTRLLTTISSVTRADDARLAAFHGGIYWDAFAAQHEPLAVWQAALRGELAYELHVRLATTGDTIVGGIAYERYPRSGCGLVTYLVIAPAARGSGLGRRLLEDAVAALYGAGAPAVFGEINDPRTQTREPTAVARARLARFERWGATVVATRYVQPALAPGLARDETLLLIVFGPPVAGALVRDFVAELYAVTEDGAW